MQEPKALGRVVELVRDLRRRCPWDAAQTPASLRPYLVEEALELDAALGHPDPSHVRDELGDVLLHLAFQIVLGEESGAFGAEDVVKAIEEKMWRRHPLLFPAPAAEGQKRQEGQVGEEGEKGEKPKRVAAAARSWERLKLRDPGRTSLLDGLPPNLPELIAAYRLQERAAGVGFDWPDAQGPLEKVREETTEIAAEMTQGASAARIEAEIGDLFFAAVNLARKLGCDPRAALDRANQRFKERFRTVERLAAERGIDMATAGLDVLDGLWNDAKRAGPGGGGAPA